MSKFGKFNLDEFDVKKEKSVVAIDEKTEEPVLQHAKVDKKAVGSVVASRPFNKVPMMNIRFTPENYDYMRREAALRGLSVIKFTNWIIDQYRSDPSHVHTNDLYQNEKNW